MNIHFHIEYQTAFGEELVLNHVSAATQEVTAYKMGTTDGYHWSCEMRGVLTIGAAIDYYYSVMRGDELLRREWVQQTHRLELACSSRDTYHVYDHWVDVPENAYLYSSAMTECVNRHAHAPIETSSFLRTIRFKVRAPQLRREERLGIVGSEEVLGAWQLQQALPMAEHNRNEWIIDVMAPNCHAHSSSSSWPSMTTPTGCPSGRKARTAGSSCPIWRMATWWFTNCRRHASISTT